MTKQPESSTTQVGYGPDEITVTPAMIASGLKALSDALGAADERELVISVYTAMAAVRPL